MKFQIFWHKTHPLHKTEVTKHFHGVWSIGDSHICAFSILVHTAAGGKACGGVLMCDADNIGLRCYFWSCYSLWRPITRWDLTTLPQGCLLVWWAGGTKSIKWFVRSWHHSHTKDPSSGVVIWMWTLKTILIDN